MSWRNSLATTAALGLSFPGSVTTAEAKKGHGWGHHHKAKVHHNRGRHLGWYTGPTIVART